LKAKTSYCCCYTKLIVERLEAERKELDIGIKAEPEAEPKAERREVELSIKVIAKVGRIYLYSEVAEKIGQADPYASNLLVFLEDSEAKVVTKRIEVAGKLDTQNSEILDS
jgi:hypothetical protein